MAGRGLRNGLLRLIDTRWSASLLGIVFGAVTQSTNAVTFIVTSMVTANLVQVRAVMPVVVWANLGTGVLVFLSTLNIRPFILSLLGLIGLAYFLNIEKSTRYRHVAAALFGSHCSFSGSIWSRRRRRRWGASPGVSGTHLPGPIACCQPESHRRNRRVSR